MYVHQLYKCTSLVRDVDSGGGNARVGTGDIWKISVPSFNLLETKAALKI